MKRISAQKVSYELKEKLGEGLTSEVYKAFRVDGKKTTRQLVALKSLKSKKNVQVFKHEFEKLTKVRSKHCVQLYAWENLSQGPGLILEYIDGVTLSALHESNRLTADLVEEVVFQVKKGLQALHCNDVYHGDLNLKNIMLDQSGCVKLIDFGFFDEQTGSYITPEFASPSLMKGEKPSVESDFYSLQKIKTHLLQSCQRTEQANKKSSLQRQALLAKVVQEIKNQTTMETQVIAQSRKHDSVGRWLSYSLSWLVFLCCLFYTDFTHFKPKFGGFRLVTHQWAQVSLNGLPYQYSPVLRERLRVGLYDVTWITDQGKGQMEFILQSNKTFLLKPSKQALR